jgi:alcohol dehydrogenase (NADP+)
MEADHHGGQMHITRYLALLRRDGTLAQVGAQVGNPDDEVFEIPAPELINERNIIASSMIGAPREIREMLQLVAEKKLKPWVEEHTMKDANQAIVDMDKGGAKCRYLLANEDHL